MEVGDADSFGGGHALDVPLPRAAELHTNAQLAAFMRRGKPGITAAFVLCSPQYRATFGNSVDRSLTTLQRTWEFKELLGKQRNATLAIVGSRGDSNAGPLHVMVEAQNLNRTLGVDVVASASESSSRFELTLELTPDGWLTSSVGVVTLTIESLQLAVDFHVTLLSTHTIAEVKRMITDKHGIPVGDQELVPMVEGDTKDEAHTLARRNVSDSRLKLKLICSLLSAEPQPITVKTLSRRVFSFEVTAAMTVYNLKEQIRDACGMPEEQQRLIFAGKLLDEQFELRKYNVWRGAELILMPQLEWHAIPPLSCTMRAGTVPWYEWTGRKVDVQI